MDPKQAIQHCLSLVSQVAQSLQGQPESAQAMQALSQVAMLLTHLEQIAPGGSPQGAPQSGIGQGGPSGALGSMVSRGTPQGAPVPGRQGPGY